MFSEELNKLIEASLVDGVLTDKERSVIRKRALLEGVDPDEVDLILDAEIHKLQKTNTTHKHGVLKKCPSCNATVEAGAVKCNYCGYVFSGIEANSSAKILFEKLEEIDKAYREKGDNGTISMLFGKKTTAQKQDEERANLIRNFPIPTSKDDFLEFIPSMEAKWHNTSLTHSNGFEGQEKMAYRSKYIECMQKAQVSFSNDKDFSILFERYKKNRYSLDNYNVFQRCLMLLGLIFLVILLVLIF